MMQSPSVVPPGPDSNGRPIARLPGSLRPDDATVRTRMLRRLSTSRLFALGDRAGVLRAAQKRSGLAFRLDCRQRVIVKGLVSRHRGRGQVRLGGLAAHVAYLSRAGAGEEGQAAAFFDRREDVVDATDQIAAWASDRHHFRFIVSPEHGDRLRDLRDYVREVMTRVTADLGEPELTWMAACHFDTDQPHAHVLVRGRRADGTDLVIPRAYMGYGFRARAQEVAQERLGDLSRQDAERRVWRETTADRFTAFDRRLLAAREADSTVADGIGGSEAWAALTRGRLRHLEALGLAERTGRRFRLAPDLEDRLRRLQVSRDVIRTLNEQRLRRGVEVQALGAGCLRGRIMASGRHDEIGLSPWIVVQDAKGGEHYARLGPGIIPPAAGATVELASDGAGPARLVAARGRQNDRGL